MKKTNVYFILILLCCFICICSNKVIGSEISASKYDAYFVNVLQKIADYSIPGVGVDEKVYLPLDHVRIDPESSLIHSEGSYTAASKIGPYLVFLIKVYQAEGYYSEINILAKEEEVSSLARYGLEANNQSISLLRIHRMLNTIENFFREERDAAPYMGGMLPWLSVNRDGSVKRDKDLVPLLDNGLLTWAYVAALEVLQGDDNALAIIVRQQIETLLSNQRYEYFLNKDNACFYGEINVTTGIGNEEYILERLWTEDMLSVLWGILTVSMTEKEKFLIWNKLFNDIDEWDMGNGEFIDVPKGYIASNHELIWTLMYLPILDTKLGDLFYNSQQAQADYAIKLNLPGYQAVAYDALGTYAKMGMSPIAEFPEFIQRDDCAVVFATAAAMYTESTLTRKWLYDLIKGQGLLTEYGPIESIGPEGKADILSADSQYLIAAALGGGVRKEVSNYLKKTKIKGLYLSYYDYMNLLFDASYQDIESNLSFGEISTAKHLYPRSIGKKYSPPQVIYANQPPTYEILDNLAESLDDRHGSRVYSPVNENVRWGFNDGIMDVSYKIPEDANKYYRFSWWGTYLGKNRIYLAPYNKVKVTISNQPERQIFKLLLKREDTDLIKPIIIDTINSGEISGDGKWVTYEFELKHRRRFLKYPLSYIAFSVDDPIKEHWRPYFGSIKIKSVELYNDNISDGKLNVEEAIDAIGSIEPFIKAPPRSLPMVGIEPVFLDSGAIGEATENITREKNQLLYLEYEDVDINKGFSGIWTSFDPIDLKGVRYLVFDVLEGHLGEAPTLLNVELKYQVGDFEKLIYGWNINLAETLCCWNINLSHYGITRKQWYRVILPLPDNIREKKCNMINFVYENWVGKEPTGSLEISSPVFTDEINDKIYDDEAIICLSPALKKGEERSLFQQWQVKELNTNFNSNAQFNENSELEVSGDGGWVGAKLYPSSRASAMGDKLIISIIPLGEDPCSGAIELKKGQITIYKSDPFYYNPNDIYSKNLRACQYIFDIEISDSLLCEAIDYMAISDIKGKFIIEDITAIKEK